MKPTKVIIDADMLVYKSTAAAEHEIDWGDGLWTLHSYLNEAICNFKDMVTTIYNNLTLKVNTSLDDEPVMAFSDPQHNFRKDLYDDYKGNRKGKRKPVCYNALREWVENNYKCKCFKNLEGDDVMGIIATSDDTSPCILVSADKDFKTIPCDFYDFNNDELHHITVRDAYRNHAYQTLVGDRADNYPGCKGYGPVKAQRLLDKTDDKDLWNEVIKAFESTGLTKDDALVQAQCAHILWNKDYNPDTGEVYLWDFP